MCRLVGIAANKRRTDCAIALRPQNLSALPPLSAPVLGYVLFAGMRIDIRAEKLCHQKDPGRDRLSGRS